VSEVLLLLATPPNEYNVYPAALQAAFPDILITMIGHHDEVAEHIGTADVLMTFGAQLRDHVLLEAPRLRWVQSLGAGVDGIADSPALRDDVVVTNIRGVHGVPVSEAIMAMMLALSRQLARSVAAQALRRWDRFPPGLLDGKTVGILGVGAIAEALAPRCKAFGMRVVGLTSSIRRVPHFDELRDRSRLPGAVGDLDVLVILLPLSDATVGIVNGDVIRAMKLGSMLINVARGELIDEAALLAGLSDGPLTSVALDVFQQEPLPETHPFWSSSNLLITPHLAGLWDNYAERTLPQIIDNMRRYLQGGPGELLNSVPHRRRAVAGG
jgi:D-2-hydroxyacid dehydrogenase (NADP+)